jgi:hypothetical protein
MRSYEMVASKDMNMEAEESIVLGAVTKQRLVKTAEWEGVMHAAVNCRMREFSIAL